MYFIGIDLGTSSVKLLLMDDKGQIIHTVTKEYPISFPQTGWSEQNPKDWYEQTILGIRELIMDIDSSKVTGISFGGQMHGLVILDQEDQVIRPAILWNDNRTYEECDYLNQVIGRDKLTQYTGNIAFTGFTAPKLLWMKKHETDNFHRIRKIMLPKDFLIYRLTGIHATDVSDASGMLLFDVNHRCWSEEMLQICGIPKAYMAKIYESYECVGNLKSAVAKELGLPETVKVIAGAGDNAAAAVGTGTVGDGNCNISLGTSGTIFISSNHYRVDQNNALHAFAHADGNYHLMGCMLSAASCNQWWMNGIIETTEYSKEQALIKDQMLGNNHVFFLPYLMGERSPHNDPYARGTFTGISLDTTRTDMTLSILEGVAFAIRDSFEVAGNLGINITETTICGGGAKSELWKRIIANVLNIRVKVLETEEGPALGAAMLAAVGCHVFPSVEDAAQSIVRVSSVIDPDPEIAARYQRKYQQFQSIYPALKPIFQMIQQ